MVAYSREVYRPSDFKEDQRDSSEIVICEISLVLEYPSLSSETTVDHNIFINVSTGLGLGEAKGQRVHDNLFAECPGYAILADNPYDESTTLFYSNIFINNNGAGEEFNSSHIQARCENNYDYWNNSYLRGNYWSDWTGPDLNNDGIVDDPYPLSGGCKHG